MVAPTASIAVTSQKTNQEEPTMTPIELVNLAIEAREHSYCPYSNFAVGAALMTKDGKIYQGCNIENSAFGPTNCAERTAFFTAVYQGEREFEAIAVVGGKAGQPVSELCAPCGVCRQVMREFCKDDFKIYLSKGDGTYV
ncbi:MAG: cytidine deaminase, partial [Oscillospiraceae bacterium]|nr:cytidine deaminase [Oscillospiraceae bacterium]